MRKRVLVLLPIIIFAVGAIVLGMINRKPAPTQTETRTETVVYRGITYYPPTVPIDPKLEDRVLRYLTANPPADGLVSYVVTNDDYREPYHYISVAGFQGSPDQWSLEDSGWLGVVIAVDPSINPEIPVYTKVQENPQEESGYGGAGYILPFRSGTQAMYGELGVHNCGFQLNGWKAVDLFPSENQIYAAQASEVSYVCRDGTQVALRIGNHLYDHLHDSGQQVGDRYNQGQALGSLVPGTFNTACGYASQNANAYHVHFCFLPDQSGGYYADGYMLNVNNSLWTKDGTSVAPLGYLTANWANASVTGSNGPAQGVNFWDGAVSALMPIVQRSVAALPAHQFMDIANKIIGVATPILAFIYTICFTIFNMTIAMWAIGIWFTLEGIRIAVAAYTLVIKQIPVIGR